MMEAIGLKPGQRWAAAAALSEFGGGVLTALGLFNPLGPLSIMASMSMATATVHWGKPIWVTAGGAELPITNMAITGALTLWTRSYFASTAGNVSQATIQAYIDAQKGLR